VATEAQLTDEIQRIKAALLALGDLRPGALSEQYNTCRTPGCRCKADPPQRHGPYHQLSYSHHGRSRTENIRPEHIEPSPPRSPTTARCATSSTNGSTPPSNWTTSDAAHPDNGLRPHAQRRRPFTSNQHKPSSHGARTPRNTGLSSLRYPATAILRLV